MDPALTEELRAIARSARAALRQLAEEGVETCERAAPAETSAPAQREPTPSPGAPVPAPCSDLGQIDILDAAMPSGPRPTLDQIREALGDCRRCRLCEQRTQIVFGDGNPDADL
ncbi:MAG: uracil-DNA glycosylase, partial [Myxococcales bacterium]|nr:uracil-DNA glycosylase [Myxococcales bacterium]